MTRLEWGDIPSRTTEYGADRGVFYPRSGFAVPWNGLISVKESLPLPDRPPVYSDGFKQKARDGYGDFTLDVEAYTYPSAFEDLAIRDPWNRLKPSMPFDFVYRTKTLTGYNLHLVYNAVAVRSDKNNATIEQDPEVATLAWTFYTKPVNIPGLAPSSHLILNSDIAWPTATQALEDRLYGTATTSARMPSPTEALSIIDNNGWLAIVDHGNGMFTASGPAVSLLSATEFSITSPTALYISSTQYELSNH